MTKLECKRIEAGLNKAIFFFNFSLNRQRNRNRG